MPLLVCKSVDAFCYLGDMLSAGGGVEEAVALSGEGMCLGQSSYADFMIFHADFNNERDLLKGEGKIYGKACVQSVMMYGSETWAMKG